MSTQTMGWPVLHLNVARCSCGAPGLHVHGTTKPPPPKPLADAMRPEDV